MKYSMSRDPFIAFIASTIQGLVLARDPGSVSSIRCYSPSSPIFVFIISCTYRQQYHLKFPIYAAMEISSEITRLPHFTPVTSLPKGASVFVQRSPNVTTNVSVVFHTLCTTYRPALSVNNTMSHDAIVIQFTPLREGRQQNCTLFNILCCSYLHSIPNLFSLFLFERIYFLWIRNNFIFFSAPIFQRFLVGKVRRNTSFYKINAPPVCIVGTLPIVSIFCS